MSGAIPAAGFVAALRAHGVRRVTGVPCGHLAGPWALFDQAGDLIPAASEGAALAIAAGWELAGEPGAVLCQNSGFGNLVNPLTSLVLPYRIPVLVVMTLRGWPDPAGDEPQHAVMGTSTVALLEAFDVPHAVLSEDTLAPALAAAAAARAQRRPFFLLVPMKTIGPAPAAEAASAPPAPAVLPAPGGARLTRPLVVAALLAALTDELLVTTTGYLSRQAHHERDRPGTLYMQGSMGHAAAIGLGLATAQPCRRTVVLDGDGAFLMHLGTGSTIGAAAPDNLVHVIVDNGCYESTGCQPSTAATADFAAVGRALGYRTVLSAVRRDELGQAIKAALTAPGPVLCAFRVMPTPGEVYPRATASAGPEVIMRRFAGEAARKLPPS
jgi:phosphonopyruvate decarboxylase